MVNNGHTIQVDMLGENHITVRGGIYKLVQMHFHHPSEERVNFKSFAMVAHLVHKNAEGQLAVVARPATPTTRRWKPAPRRQGPAQAGGMRSSWPG